MAADRRTRAARGPEALRVTLVRSPIGHNPGAHGTLRALGLRRLHQTVEVADTPVARGMLRRVAFLLRVDEPAAAAERQAQPTSDEDESA